MDKEESNRDVSTWTFMPLKTYAPPAQPLPETTDWKPGVQAFEDQVRGLGAEAPQAVIGLFGKAGQLLRAWAEMRGGQMLEPPPVSALLDGTAGLWPELRNPGDAL